MHHGLEFTVVFILCFTLAVGAALRTLCRRLSIPYTIAMLLVGLGVGLGIHVLGEELGVLHNLSAGSAIAPELIILIFLPTLVFESAFAVEVHALRKDVVPVLLLAVPALLLSTFAVGAVMFFLTASNWQWSMLECLVFGALISATDPVAVVALLRELGAPKRLGLLIEGESLLNDGTSIVIFGVLLELLTKGGHFDAGHTLLHFLQVTLGGFLLGLVLAMLFTRWMASIFNDRVAEITITILLAYLAMLLAEGLLHLSGVMAVVAAGLWLGGPGRTAISPEVEHFLHRFWEMLSYLANTLIFFLVGLVVAAQAHRASWHELVLIIVAYLCLMAVRAAITFLFRPLMGRLGPPVSTAEATVVAWGGLRGAVSLALALIISQHPELPQYLRDQVLLITAGVVLLTVLVNGSSLAALLRMLKLDKAPVGNRLAALATQKSVLETVRRKIREVSDQRDLRTVHWQQVDEQLEQRIQENQEQLEQAREELHERGAEEQLRGLWFLALGVERQAYWRAFSKGQLNSRTAALLDHEVDRHLDLLESGQLTPPGSHHPRRLERLLRRIGTGPFQWVGFEALTLRHDLARGESLAADAVLRELDQLEAIDPQSEQQIRDTYLKYRRQATEALEDLRNNLPEITRAIETRLAQRIQLNLERAAYHEQAERGALAPEVAEESIHLVEQRMKQLLTAPKHLKMPETADLVKESELFKDMDETHLEELARITLERILSPDEMLFQQGDEGRSLFIVARGALLVYQDDRLLDVLGGGEVLGEFALLTGQPRTCSIQAATTVTVGEISRQDFDELVQRAPRLMEGVWKTFARRRFSDCLRDSPRYQHLDHHARVSWFARGDHHKLKPEQQFQTRHAFLAFGQVRVEELTVIAPAFLPAGVELVAQEESWVVDLPDL